ncbi:hypothetical protein [Sporosarcina psychrophila]|nr:hypothetical protein [Sporosarcina psychrophila]
MLKIKENKTKQKSYKVTSNQLYTKLFYATKKTMNEVNHKLREFLSKKH